MPNPAAGFFGKLPSAGDFVQRRLPPGFVESWDRHFENAVAESRGALGGSWHAAYHASPVWRFLLAPGVCGELAWAGVMGPGTDRVGRCFPMVIAAPLAADASSCEQALLGGGRWFDAAERVHVDAQVGAATSVDAFDAQVAALPDPLAVEPADAADFLREVDWSAASHWRLPMPVAAATDVFLRDLWKHVTRAPGGWCLWWTTGSEQLPASVLVTRGLPQPAAYAGFLDAGYGVLPWQSAGVSAMSAVNLRAAPPAAAVVASAPGSSATAWLPEDPELFSDLPGTSTDMSAQESTAHSGAADRDAALPEPPAGVALLQRQDCALTLLAAEVGQCDPRQQGVAAVRAIGAELPAAELSAGMQTLRTRIMALNPGLRLAGEDLIDPVPEDCAVIAAHVAGGQVDLLRIGTAAAWHWRHGRLQPFFAKSNAPPAAGAGLDDDFDELLFSRVSLAAPGLGATAQPTCGEVFSAVQAGDRLLLVATQPLVQLSPEILARSLAMTSCDEARRRIAAAAGLAEDPAVWPLAIVEIDA